MTNCTQPSGAADKDAMPFPPGQGQVTGRAGQVPDGRHASAAQGSFWQTHSSEEVCPDRKKNLWPRGSSAPWFLVGELARPRALTEQLGTGVAGGIEKQVRVGETENLKTPGPKWAGGWRH